MTITPVLDPEGTITHFVAIKQDVTSEARFEQALRESEETLRAISSSALEAIVVIDPLGRISFWNEAAESLFGCAKGEAVNKAFQEFVAGNAFRGALFEFQQPAVAFPVGRTLELTGVRMDGTEFPMEVSIASFALRARPHAVVIVRNTSERARERVEREQMEIQLRHAQKIESIGQLAAGIAHEINTPTQYIGDNLEFLRGGFASLDKILASHEHLLRSIQSQAVCLDEANAAEETARAADIGYLRDEIPKAVAAAIDGVSRVTRIVRAMKDFSHPGSTERSPLNLNQAIESTITVARNEWKYVADLETDFDPALPPVRCLPGEFNQVILNLIVNAAHAVSDVVGGHHGGKGKITIRTRVFDRWAEVRIQDSGSGIPAKIRDRVFDPFFTTKAVGRGTGQGLAIAHSVIVDKHRGQIFFETETGAGTTFIVRLPLDANEEP